MEHAREQSPKAAKVTFGSYVLHDRIGAGGMAEIFLATKQAGAAGMGIGGRGHGVERELVIKRILPSLSGDDQFVKMFVEEARLCVNLKHPNIVEVYDLGAVEAQYFIAMEYVHGRDLLKTLAACAKKRVAFPTDLALFIVMEVLKALDYAHNMRGVDGQPLGIIHRDVSPSNVLLSFDGRVKLGDFGIAKASTRERTATGILKGKFGYMAPEQVMARQIDHRADVFAVGILLYELLTGHRLFAGRNDLAVLERVRDAVIDPPPRFYRPDLSRELESIVLKALSRDANARFQSTSELHEALYNYTFKKGVVVTARTLSRFLHELFLIDETEEHFGATAAKLSVPAVPVHAAAAKPGANPLGRAAISGPDRELSGIRALRDETSNERVAVVEPAGPRLVPYDNDRGFDEESTENPDHFDDAPTTNGERPDSILPFPGAEANKASFMLPTQPGDEADEEVEAHTDLLEGGAVDDPAEIPRNVEALPIGRPSARRVSLEPVDGSSDSSLDRSARSSLPSKKPSLRPTPGSEVRALRKTTAENGETAMDLEEHKKGVRHGEDEEVSALTPYGGVPVMQGSTPVLEDVTVDAGSLGHEVVEAVRRALDPTEPFESTTSDAERTDLLADVGAQLGLTEVPEIQASPRSTPPAAARTGSDELAEELDFVEIDGSGHALADATQPGDGTAEQELPEAWVEPTRDERTGSGSAIIAAELREEGLEEHTNTAIRAPDEEDATTRSEGEWGDEVSLLQAESLLVDEDPSRALPRVVESSVALRNVERRMSSGGPVSGLTARPLIEAAPSDSTQAPVPPDVAAAWSSIISRNPAPRPVSSIVTSPRSEPEDEELAQLRRPSMSRGASGGAGAPYDGPTTGFDGPTDIPLDVAPDPTIDARAELEGEDDDGGPPTEDIADAAREALAQSPPAPQVSSPWTPVLRAQDPRALDPLAPPASRSIAPRAPSLQVPDPSDATRALAVPEALPVARPRRTPSASRAVRGASARAEPRKRVATQVPLMVVNPPRAPSVMEEPANDETRLGALARPVSTHEILERGSTRLGRLDGDDSASADGPAPLVPESRARRESSGITAALSEAALVDAEIRALRTPSLGSPVPGNGRALARGTSRAPSREDSVAPPMDEHTDNGELVALERALGLVDDPSHSTGPRPSIGRGTSKRPLAPSVKPSDVEETSNGPAPKAPPMLDAGRLDDEGASDLFGALAVLDKEPSDLDLRSFDPAEEGSFETTASIELAGADDDAPSPVVRSSVEFPLQPKKSDPGQYLQPKSIEMVRPVLPDEPRYSGIIAPSVAAALRGDGQGPLRGDGPGPLRGGQAPAETTNVRDVPRDPAEEPSGIVMRFDEPTRPIDEDEAISRVPRVDPMVMPRSDSDSISSSAIVDQQPDYRPQSYLLPKAPLRLSSEPSDVFSAGDLSHPSGGSREAMDRSETPASLDFMAASSGSDQQLRSLLGNSGSSAPAARKSGPAARAPAAPSLAASERGVYEEEAEGGGPSLVSEDFDVQFGGKLASANAPAVPLPSTSARKTGAKVSVLPARVSTPPSQDSEGPSVAAARLRAVVERQRPAKEKLRTAEIVTSNPPPAGAPTATAFFGPGVTDPLLNEPPRARPSMSPPQPAASLGGGAMTGPGVVPSHHNPSPRKQVLTTRRALWVLAASVFIVGVTLAVIAMRKPSAQAIPPVSRNTAPGRQRPVTPPASPPLPTQAARPAETAPAAAALVETARMEAERRASEARIEAARQADDERRAAEARREEIRRAAEERAERAAPEEKPRRAAAPIIDDRRGTRDTGEDPPAARAEPRPEAARAEPTRAARPTPPPAAPAPARPEPTRAARPAPPPAAAEPPVAEPPAAEARAAEKSEGKATRPGAALPAGMGALRFDCAEPATVIIKPGGGTFPGVTKKEIQLKKGNYTVIIRRSNGSTKNSPARVIAGSPAEVPCDQ